MPLSMTDSLSNSYDFSISAGAVFSAQATRRRIKAGDYYNIVVANPSGSDRILYLDAIISSIDLQAGQRTLWGFIVGQAPTAGMTPVFVGTHRVVPGMIPASVAQCFYSVGPRLVGPGGVNSDGAIVLAPGNDAFTPRVLIGPGIQIGFSLEAPPGGMDAAILVSFHEINDLGEFATNKLTDIAAIVPASEKVDILYTDGPDVKRFPVVFWAHFVDGTIRGCTADNTGKIIDAKSIPGFIGYSTPGTPGIQVS